jgi:hypothetical protein
LDLYVDDDLKPAKEAIEDLHDYVQVLIDNLLEQEPDYLPYVRTLVE